MSERDNHAATPESDLKRTLVRRVVLAGLMIAALLGVLAIIDSLGRRSADDTPVSTGPTYTAPVPVMKKGVVQQGGATPPAAEAALSAPASSNTVSHAEGTSTSQGMQPLSSSPPSEISVPSVAAPPRPELAAQPSLPVVAGSKPVVVSRFSRSPKNADSLTPTPAEGSAMPSSTSHGAASKSSHNIGTPPAQDEPYPSPRSGYAVQSGVFSDAQQAEDLRARLVLNGIPSTLEARVQVGPFKTRAEAEAARLKLKEMGIEGLLLMPPAKEKKR